VNHPFTAGLAIYRMPDRKPGVDTRCTRGRRWCRHHHPVLAAYRAGEPGQGFPGGDSGEELAARIGRALRVIARWAEPKTPSLSPMAPASGPRRQR
jgi:hypothetical protein